MFNFVGQYFFLISNYVDKIQYIYLEKNKPNQTKTPDSNSREIASGKMRKYTCQNRLLLLQGQESEERTSKDI